MCWAKSICVAWWMKNNRAAGWWNNSPSFSLNSIQFQCKGFIGMETHVNIAKASELDNKQKWNQQ